MTTCRDTATDGRLFCRVYFTILFLLWSAPVKKSSYPPSGYSWYEYEHRNHVNRFYNSSTPVCILQTGVFCRLSITSCIYPLQRNDEIGGAAHGFFLKNFFKNFSARLPKRMMQTVLVAKGEENRITRLCGREGGWIHERAHIILGASMRNTQSWRHSIQGKRS